MAEQNTTQTEAHCHAPQQFTVLAYVKQLTVLGENEEREALPLCVTALEELRLRLRPAANMQDIRLLQAAAATVFYRLQLREYHAGGMVERFKAGDVSIQNSPVGVQHAQTILQEALAAAAPLLEDTAFCFRNV